MSECSACKYHSEFSTRVNTLMKNQQNIITMLVINTFFILVLIAVTTIAFYDVRQHTHTTNPIHYKYTPYEKYRGLND